MKKKQDPNLPIVVNGITYANQDELDKRIKSDSEELAKLLLSIYRKKTGKRKRIYYLETDIFPRF
jgi:hypothetical protein